MIGEGAGIVHTVVPFSAVHRVRSFEDIVEQIRDAVVSGALPPGSRLPAERDLAASFNVSRPTLREALRSLEAIGIIEIRAGKSGGVFVIAPSSAQVASALDTMFRFHGATIGELAEVRTSFEAENAFWAAQRADDVDIATLKSQAEEFERLTRIESTEWRVLSRLDIEFHETVAVASKNQVRVAIMRGINTAFFRFSSALEPVASPSVREDITRDIWGVHDAIVARDADLARKLMHAHVNEYSKMEMNVREVPPVSLDESLS